MNFVITLIASPQREALTQAFVDSMAPPLAVQGLVVEKSVWLEPGVACDLFVTHDNRSALDALVQDIVRDQPYDAVVQPASGRRKKLLISDMDSTMITIECIDELADFVGKKKEVSVITERAMNGELDFAAALTERVALLAGLPESVLQQAYGERVKMMPGAKALVSAMRGWGAHCVLVSGGFTFFTSRVAKELGFHEDHANVLLVEDGKLTGKVQLPILGKEAKLKTLQETCAKLGITSDDVLAVGDGANDLPMLLAAGLGVAYHAKPVVRAQAGARIAHCDLSALLYAQGVTP
jgi:phosphoserine phosphatase